MYKKRRLLEDYSLSQILVFIVIVSQWIFIFPLADVGFYLLTETSQKNIMMKHQSFFLL